MMSRRNTEATQQPTVALTTVGCRLNQAETDAVQDAFAAAGYRIVSFDDSPDVHYLNTCTVTGRADRSSRQYIHRARREHPDSVLIVAGCFANRAAQELAEGGEVDLVLGQREKMRPLYHLVDPFVRPEKPLIAMDGTGDSIPASVGVRVTGRSRAFLKVQDGCDHSCTYCAVAPARGPSVSASRSEVLEALRRIKDAGYEEVVFTGVDISDWKENDNLVAKNGSDFVSLVELASEIGLPRIRISSLEPWSLTPERIQRLTAVDAWCEHIHLALQSGDPGVLRRMNRQMDLGQVRETMQELIRLRPHATLGADLIAGFPGETDDAFENTISLLREGWVHYLHVFPFSPRPGTPAAKMRNQIPTETVLKRASRLRKLSDNFKNAKMLAMYGHKSELLVEQDKRTGYLKNYLRAVLSEDASRGAGKIVPVKVTGFDERKKLLEVEEMR